LHSAAKPYRQLNTNSAPVKIQKKKLNPCNNI
jgi:hypothetical protein